MKLRMKAPGLDFEAEGDAELVSYAAESLFRMPERETPSSHSFNAILAAYLTVRPNRWIDGKELATIAGGYGWRSRCSDLRRAPWNLTIENRQERVKLPNGQRFTRSLYRLVQP